MSCHMINMEFVIGCIYHCVSRCDAGETCVDWLSSLSASIQFRPIWRLPMTQVGEIPSSYSYLIISDQYFIQQHSLFINTVFNVFDAPSCRLISVSSHETQVSCRIIISWLGTTITKKQAYMGSKTNMFSNGCSHFKLFLNP